MATQLTLQGDGGDLSVEVGVNEYGWSLCYLWGEDKVYLGAETASHLLPRLQDAVQDDIQDWPAVGEMAGYPARCALMLAEAHHALYIADSGTDRLLFWQAMGQEPIMLMGTIRLSPEQRRQWRDQLTLAWQDYSLSRARRAAITKEIAKTVGGAEALK